MRARYAAHALGRYDFLTESIHPEFREEADADDIREWSSLMTWESLEILETSAGGPEDETGEVSFCAHYSVQGMPQELREDAFFRKEDGRWFYVEGNVHARQPVRREGPKVGRGDPAPAAAERNTRSAACPASAGTCADAAMHVD